MSTPTPTPVITQPASTLQAAIDAFVLDAGNAAVAFGVFGTSTASVVESAVVGAVSIAFVIANELRAGALAKAGLLRR